MTRIDKIVGLPRKVIRRWSDRGSLDTARWAWSHVASRYREWSLNIETEAWVEVEELGYESESHGYEPITYARLDSVMQSIEVKPDEDVFLDYGCGKGRALVLAGLQPFRRIIGVEMSPELSGIARDNIERARNKLICREYEVVTTDASRYEVPADVSVPGRLEKDSGLTCV